MLRWRLATALALGPVVLGVIALGRWAIFIAVLVVIGIAAYELSQSIRPLPFPAALGAGAIPILLSAPSGLYGVLAGVLLSLPWALLWLAGKPDSRTLHSLLAILLMALWVGTPLAHLVLLAGQVNGRILVLAAVMGTWVSDAGAYFGGRLFGRHLMFPVLSPKKTVEGGIGGLVVTVLVIGWGAHQFLGLAFPVAAVVGALISVCAQLGDLFESTLKRILDTKDIGHLLPGHGGILDRIDSLLFVAPALYYVLLFV